MTRWIEVSLRADGESAEALADLLARYGHQGVSIEQLGIAPDRWDEGEIPQAERVLLRAYIPDDERLETTKRELETALGHMRLMYPMPQPSYQALESEDWAEAWKAHYQPLRIGRRLLIRPLWIDAELAAGDIEIALDPGMAFGTGAHPTTQLCLEALERLIEPAQEALDLGSGSGILAIAAAKLGARKVLALDTDPIAVEATAENARVNGVDAKVIARRGSLENVLGGARRFDVLTVNILARVIVKLAEQRLGELLRPGGAAIFSGIIDTQADEVEAALRRSGLRPCGRCQRGDWMLIEARRKRE